MKHLLGQRDWFSRVLRRAVGSRTSGTLVLLVICLFMLALGSSAQAASSSQSVLMVPSSVGGASNGGDLPETGFRDGYAPSFTDANPADIADGTIPDPIAGHDTVALVQVCDIGTYLADPDFKSRLDGFVSGGGKLLVWDSECSGSSTPDYSNFVYPFTSDNPGAGGSECDPQTRADCFLDDVENNSLGNDDDPLSNRFLDVTKISDDTDAVGDANVFTTQNAAWCVDMVAKNVNSEGIGGGKQGPVQAYARLGAGLIVYDGLDMDAADASDGFDNSTGDAALNRVWEQNLTQAFNPDGLPCNVVATGITLSPPSATNTVGQNHTVTATVRDNLGNPLAGKTVTFTVISGPNAGKTGAGTSDASGHATFTYTSSVAGTDQIQASFDANEGTSPADIRQSNTVTKTWVAAVVTTGKPAAKASIRGGRKRCTRTTASARVSGQNISTVTYSLDGKRIKKAKGNKTSVTVNAKRLKSGTHRITARITFTGATGAKAQTKRVSFVRCARRAARPKFTG
ncbi:MAG: Ig-like domain-containing protein [Vicinamibacterales bacterium]